MLVNEAAELASGVLGVAHSLVIVADDCLSDQGGEVVVITPANTLDSNGDVGCRDCVVTNSDI